MKKPTTYLLVSNYTTNIIHGSVKMFKRSLSNVKILENSKEKRLGVKKQLQKAHLNIRHDEIQN